MSEPRQPAKAPPASTPQGAQAGGADAVLVDRSSRGEHLRALAHLAAHGPRAVAQRQRYAAWLEGAKGPVAGQPVVQGYFEFRHAQEMEAVLRYLRRDGGLMAAFRRIEADETTPVRLDDWLADVAHLHISDIYDALDGTETRGDPRARVDYSDLEAAPRGEPEGVREPAPEAPREALEAAPQPQGWWMSGRATLHENSFFVVTEAGGWFRLVSDAPPRNGQQIQFWVTAQDPTTGHAAAAGPVADDEEAPRTVPPSTIASGDALTWLAQWGARTRELAIRMAAQDLDPARAREFIDNWNAAHTANPIALEDVGWDIGRYQAAVRAPEAVAPTTFSIDLGAGPVDARILNDSGGYHLILEHPERADLVIRVRRNEEATSVDAGMANLARLARTLPGATRGAIRAPQAAPLSPMAYIVERVDGAVDALVMWRRYQQLREGDQHESPEGRRLWTQLNAVQALIMANIRAMNRQEREPFPDFRPANLGRRGDELIYIDFDQAGEVKDRATLADQVAEWAGQRRRDDPGGARDADERFYAWLTEGQL